MNVWGCCKADPFVMVIKKSDGLNTLVYLSLCIFQQQDVSGVVILNRITDQLGPLSLNVRSCEVEDRQVYYGT